MNQIRESLIRNSEKYYVDEVVDYEKISNKWDFLKLDPMPWNDFAEAKSFELTDEISRTTFEEHFASIDYSIYISARIYSICLGQCFRRIKKMEYLQSFVKKYQIIIDFIDEVVVEYHNEVERIKNYIQKKPENHEYSSSSIIFNIRNHITTTEQSKYKKLLIPIEYLGFLINLLKEIKDFMLKELEKLKRAIIKIESYYNEEKNILQKSLSHMNHIRGNFLYNLIFYYKLVDKKNTPVDNKKTNIETAVSAEKKPITSEDLAVDDLLGNNANDELSPI